MSATDHERGAEREQDGDDETTAADGHETETQDDEDVTAVTELPPSAKLVYKVLEYEGSMTQDQIAAESRLCSRTVRYALGKLEDGEFVDSRVCLSDARQSKYWIPE